MRKISPVEMTSAIGIHSITVDPLEIVFIHDRIVDFQKPQ